MCRNRLCIGLMLAWVLCLPRVQAAEVVIQFDAGSAPTMYEDKAGNARGVYPAIVAAANKQMTMRDWLHRFDAAVAQLRRTHQIDRIVEEEIRVAARQHAAQQGLPR